MSQLFVVNSQRDDWQRACRLVNFLLREGAEVRWATEPFRATSTGGAEFELGRGAFLITDAACLPQSALEAAEQRYQCAAQTVENVSGFIGLQLQSPRIAMYGGGGAPFNHARIFAELGFHVEFITPQEIRAGGLSNYDLFVMPGGGGLAMMGQLNPLGETGCRMIKDWAQHGGMYLGSCAGSFNAAVVAESFVQVCPQQRHMQMVNAMIWNRGDTEWIGLESPGIGVIESRNLQPDHPIMFGMPDRFNITHYNGPLFEPAVDAIADASAAVGLSAVSGTGDAFTASENFLCFSDAGDASEQLLIERAAIEARFNIVSGRTGLGRVILFGSHPEFGENLMMDRWGLPARMLANAAFWQAGHLREARPPHIKREDGVAKAFPPGSGLALIGRACAAIGETVEALHGIDSRDRAWLAEDHAMSAFGVPGQDIWQLGLSEFAELTARMQGSLERADMLLERAHTLLSSVNGDDESDARIARLRELLQALEEAMHYQTPPAWQQDFGYEGILQMLQRVDAMLRRACQNTDMAFEVSANPYAYFDSSPYQLVVGSYLAATGVYLNSWQLLQVHLSRIDEQIFAIEVGTND